MAITAERRRDDVEPRCEPASLRGLDHNGRALYSADPIAPTSGLFTMQTAGSDSAQSDPRGRRPTNVQAVDRAAVLLKAVAAEPEPATAWQLAIRCGLNRSTAWRLLSTLESHGL